MPSRITTKSTKSSRPRGLPLPREGSTAPIDEPPADVRRLVVTPVTVFRWTWQFLMDSESRVPYIEEDKVWYAKTVPDAEAKRVALAGGQIGAPGVDPFGLPTERVKPKARTRQAPRSMFALAISPERTIQKPYGSADT